VPGATVSWQATKVEASRSGDLGYLLGTYVVTLKDSPGKSVDSGKLVEVWKKQPDGKWKCVVDTYNSDLPAATK
jgi:ketosteroid isomerase-like protein